MTDVRTLFPAWCLAACVDVQRKCRSRTGRRIVKNIAALSIGQVTTYLLPLVVIPYTAVVLGPKGFGAVALTQAVVQYSMMITSYGFSLSATRQAAVCQGDPVKLAQIVVQVWAAKFVLMLACLAASVTVFAVAPSLRPNLVAYLCGFITVAGNVLYLDWYFQAIEEMKWITAINVMPKLVLTPLIFVLVKAPSDYVLVILIQSATFLTSGVAGALLACRRLHVALPAPSLRGLGAQLKDGWRTFLATAAINLYTTTNTVLLGLMTNVTIVGYYSAGQKVVGGVQSLWTPVSQSLYPHFCKGFQTDARRTEAQLKRLLVVVLVVTLSGATVFCIAAPHLVPTYLGPKFNESIRVIQVLVFSVSAASTNTVMGLHGLLAAGLYSTFLRVVTAAALTSLVVAPIAILAGGHLGLAVCTVLIEVLIGFYEYSLLRREKML